MEINFFAENLKYLRLLKGNTLVELGEKFDLGKSQISLYENGKSYPPIPVARKICKHFNVTLDEMFENDLRPEQPPPKKIRDTEGGDLQRHVERELQEMDVGGVSKAAESPPADKTEIQEMRKKMLEMMLQLESMDAPK